MLSPNNSCQLHYLYLLAPSVGRGLFKGADNSTAAGRAPVSMHLCQDTLLVACIQKGNISSYKSNKHITSLYVRYETPLKSILHECSK